MRQTNSTLEDSYQRVQLVWLVNLLAIVLFFFGSVLFLFLLKRHFFISATTQSYLFAVSGFVSLAATGFFMLRKRPQSRASIAAIIDKKAEAKERFITVLTTAKNESTEAVISTVEQQAEQIAATFDIKKQFPLKLSFLSITALSLSAIFLLLSASLLILDPRGPLAPSAHLLDAGIREAEGLREFVGKQQSLPNDVEQRLLELAEQLEEQGILAEGVVEDIDDLLQDVDAKQQQVLELAAASQESKQKQEETKEQQPQEEERSAQRADAKQKDENNKKQDQSSDQQKEASGKKESEQGNDQKKDSGVSEQSAKQQQGQEKSKETQDGEESEQKDTKAKEKQSEEQEKQNEVGVGEGEGKGKSGASKEQFGKTQSGEDSSGAKDDSSAKNQTSSKDGSEQPREQGEKKEGDKTQTEKSEGGQKGNEQENGSSSKQAEGGGKDDQSELGKTKDKLKEIEEKIEQAQQQDNSAGEKGKEKKEQNAGDKGKEESQESQGGAQEKKEQGGESSEQGNKGEESKGSEETQQESSQPEQKDSAQQKRSGNDPRKEGENPKQGSRPGDDESYSDENSPASQSPDDAAPRQGPFGDEQGEGVPEGAILDKVEIPQDQLVNPLSLGAEDPNRYANPEDAKLQTEISETDFEKPDPSEAKEKQQIPVEYLELLE